MYKGKALVLRHISIMSPSTFTHSPSTFTHSILATIDLSTFSYQNWSGGPVLAIFLPKSVGTNF